MDDVKPGKKFAMGDIVTITGHVGTFMVLSVTREPLKATAGMSGAQVPHYVVRMDHPRRGLQLCYYNEDWDPFDLSTFDKRPWTCDTVDHVWA